MPPTNATQAFAVPIRILPDGTKIIPEGVKGASANARKAFKRIDRYLDRSSDQTIETNRIVRNMISDGQHVDPSKEQSIFKEIAQGKKFLYDNYLK